MQERLGMFDIKFVEANDGIYCDPNLAMGEILLGTFSERFEIVLEFWSKSDYERQWIDGVRRILKGSPKSSLITSLTNPATANFIAWWPIYREDSVCIFQNQFLFMDQLIDPFDIVNPYQSLDDRSQVSEDGNLISEWVVQLDDMGQWLQRQESQ
jgi:hypothetical protein